PFVEGLWRQMYGELSVKSPGTFGRAAQIQLDWMSDYLEAIAHAGQQAIEHVVAHLHPAGKVLADAGLTDSAVPRQLGLGGAGLQHHLTQDFAAARHRQHYSKVCYIAVRA